MAAELGQTYSSSSNGVAHAQRVYGVEYDLSALLGLYQSFPALASHSLPHPTSASATASVNGATEQNAQQSNSVALTTLSSGAQQGASSSLAWQGDLEQLRG